MSVHRDDTPQPNEGGKKRSASQGRPTKSERTPTQQAALDGALRREGAELATKTPTGPDLLNPLEDNKPDPSKMLPRGVTYNQAVVGVLNKDPLGKLYDSMLEGYQLNPPVFSLALLAPVDASGQITHFKSILSNIRQDLCIKHPDAVAREALIWGVGRPSHWQITGFMQELAQGGKRSLEHEVEKIELALIKNAGVRNLQGFLHKAQEKMYAWNPLPVWENAQVALVSGAQAGEIYVQQVAALLPYTKHEVARNLATIMWNRYRLSDGSAMLQGRGIGGLQLADSVLRAAIANHALSGTAECPTPKDVLRVLNPSNKNYAKDLEKIFEKLQIGSQAPQRVFLTTLVSTAHAESNVDTVLRKAIAAVSETYSRDEVESLCRLEYSLLPPNKPNLLPIPENVEYKLEAFLVSVLQSYVQASQRDFLMRVSRLQGETLLDKRTSLTGSDIIKLTELSALLAGIPKARLYEAVYGDSGVRF